MPLHRLFVSAVALVLAIAACTRHADDSAPVKSGAPASAASHPDSVPADPWTASADSALRRVLPHYLFGADTGAVAGLRECSEYQGDNPPMLMVATGARPIGHGEPAAGTSDNGEQVKDLELSVEVQSIALLTPAWDAGVSPEDIKAAGVANRDAYAAVMEPRTDTLTFVMRDYASVPRRWAMCGVLGTVRGAPSEFWHLLKREPDWVSVVRWTPSGRTWSDVTRAADSIARASR